MVSKYILLTQGWDGLPIAYHLQEAGAEVIVGQVQDKAELKLDEKEDPEDKKQRLSQYNGMLKKYPADRLVKALKKVTNKDDYFIFCDQNSLWPYAEELLKAGFTKGLFPLKSDYEMEKDRDGAMEFVEEHYPDVQIIPHQELKTVEEAKQAVEESKVPLVIQSQGDYVSTICPPDDLELNKAQILSALDKYAKDYGKGSIILKEKLIQPVEITPQIVFWNGEPVYTIIDLETKNIGDGENNGNQVGCGTNLVIATDENDPINQIAFPPKVYEMAKERKGIFVWDISLYLTADGIYFGEFCPNRFGYDCLMTETTMSGGDLVYFEALQEGQNPLQARFGGAVRVFNLNRSKDTEIIINNQDATYLYEVKKDGDQLVSVGDCWDLGVITAGGETVEATIDSLYENLASLSFKEKYARSKADFLADYPTSIVHRYLVTNHLLFEGPDLENQEEETTAYDERLTMAKKSLQDGYDKQVGELRTGHQSEIKAIRAEIKAILDAKS